MDVNVTHDQETEWLKRISNGDEKAFRSLFDRYKDRFYAAALKMTRSPELSEEIVQEVFVKLWLRRKVLARVENPTAYLFSIVYHCISAHFKKLALDRTLKERIAEIRSIQDHSTENRIAENEIRQSLQKLLLQLPPQQRKVYQLSKEEGLSRDEIAQELGISPNTVKNHLLKAIKYLRLHWERAL